MKSALSHIAAAIALALLTSCGNLSQVGKIPQLSDPTQSPDYRAMSAAGQQPNTRNTYTDRRASLWKSGPTSLLGDRRAGRLGDLLTVVIQIDDKAEISNSSSTARSGSEKLAVPSLLGIPQYLNARLPGGATTDPAVNLSSNSATSGDGSVRRNEKLTLRVAATVTDVLPNGQLKIQGSQEVRVNVELRELLVTGFVRPEDISRKNEISYDKIASARISYGGRGVISNVQRPRKGQQILDMLLPF